MEVMEGARTSARARMACDGGEGDQKAAYVAQVCKGSKKKVKGVLRVQALYFTKK